MLQDKENNIVHKVSPNNGAADAEEVNLTPLPILDGNNVTTRT